MIHLNVLDVSIMKLLLNLQGKTGERIVGPIFALDITLKTKNQALGIFFQLTEKAEKSQQKDNFLNNLKQMITTFRFLN